MKTFTPAMASVLLFAASLLLFPAMPTEACTSFVLHAEDGAAVYGRTMEWGSFDLNTRLVIVPRGYPMAAHTPDGKPGLKWKTRYGVVALDAIEENYAMDGMNEKGLVVGVLYHPGFAAYQPYDPAKADSSMGPLELANYVLTQFATVDEVRQGLEKVRVVPVPEAVLGNVPAPIHLLVLDRRGKTIVVEYLDGALHISDNPLGVLTNSPTFDWHVTNLRNYINLSAVAWPAKEIADLKFSPIGAGSGFLGLPGDYTPPSRFVRAVAYTQTARKTPNGDEAVYEALRIADNFNLPLGSAEGSKADSKLPSDMRSSTIWTSVADTGNLKYYYHTQHNRRLRMIDLKKIDFSPKDMQVRRMPLDKTKSQDIDEVTPQ